MSVSRAATATDARSTAASARPVRRRRILFLSMYDPHVPLTGAGTRGGEFVNRLAPRMDVDLVYIDGSGQRPDAELSRRYAGRLVELCSKEAIPFRQFDYFVFSRRLHAAARKLMRSHRYDYVLCDYGLSAAYGMLLQLEFGVPFIYCSHNLEYMVQVDKARRDRRRWLLAPYVYGIERLGAKRAALLVPITSGDADAYAPWVDPRKMMVIPQGVDLAVYNPFYPAPRNDPKVVLFCGNYNIQFNRDAVEAVMEEVLPRVLSRHPETRFRFLGLNPPRHVRHPNVEFPGFVEDYPSELKAADVFISPMRQGRGFPTKMVEALACGKPIVATPVAARSIERDFRCLRIRELPEFGDAVSEALEAGEPVTGADFEKVGSRYAWEANIGRLADWIDARGCV